MSVSFDDCLAKQKCKNKTKNNFLLILITKLSSTRFFCLPKPKNGHQLKFLKGRSLSFLLKQSSVINLFTYLHPSFFLLLSYNHSGVLSPEAGLGLLVSESLESVWGQGFDVCVCITLTAAAGQALRPAPVSG